MPLSTAGRGEELRELALRFADSFLARCIVRFLRMQGLDRCIVLASQAFTALIPLLMLVSSLTPADSASVISDTLIRKFGLTGDSADAVTQLFSTPDAAASSVSVFSAFLLLFSGVSFTRRLQTMYRSAWEQEKEGVRSGLFAALGLLALIVEMVVAYAVRSFVRDFPVEWLWALPIAILTGTVLWTSIPYLLLNRQVHWRRLLAAGTLSAVGTALFAVATTAYMPQVVSNYTTEFGLFGITIAVIGWLLSAAVIVVASTAIGAEFDATEGGWIGRLKVSLGLLDPVPAEAQGLDEDDLRALFRVVTNWLIMATAVWAATALVPGIHVTGGTATYLRISVVLGLVNAVLGPVVQLITQSLSWLTMGLTALVLNGVLFAGVAAVSANLAIDTLGTAIVGALVIAVVATVIELVLRPATRAVEPRQGR